MTTIESVAGGRSSVRDRRAATLERLHGERKPPPERRTRDRVRQRSARAALLPRTERPPRERRPREVLGPPPAVWYGIIGVVAVFVMLGLVMVLSASAATEANLGNSPYRVFSRQAMWAGLGVVGLIIAAKIPYRWWQRLSIPVAVLAVGAMLVPFLPAVGATVNGARSWVRVGPLSVQPSEFLKIAVVLLAAAYLAGRRESLGERKTLITLGLIAAVAGGLSLAQGDLGSAVVLGAIVLSIAWIAGVPLVPLGGMTLAAAGGALVFVVSSPRRLDRFTAFLNVTEERDHLAYQTYQGFLSMASGGLGGSGIGGSRGKLGYLPYAHSDFIFAVIADELGMIGTAAVIGGFIMLIWFGIQTALAASDRFGMLLAGGVATWFGVQAIINLGGVTGVLPVTGLTLPFFSSGGTSLFVSMVAVGLLLSVARRIERA